MKNRCPKNTSLSTPFFLDFSWFWLPKTTPKSRFFRTFFENVDFVKIVLPPRRRAYFQGSEPLKIHPKSMPKRIRKKHRKKLPKNWYWLPFWPPKPSQNRPKIRRNPSEKRCSTKLVSRCYANRQETVENQREASFVKRPYGYAYD